MENLVCDNCGHTSPPEKIADYLYSWPMEQNDDVRCPECRKNMGYSSETFIVIYKDGEIVYSDCPK